MTQSNLTPPDVIDQVVNPLSITSDAEMLLGCCWADISVSIIDPTIDVISPPKIKLPEMIPNTDAKEFVYPIFDYGYKFTTSKGTDAVANSFSMCKLFYTIEKIIYLLIDRLENMDIPQTQQVEVALIGHMLAKRKVFESIINLPHNVVIINFEPGPWGEIYLKYVQSLIDHGYDYPEVTPRDIYRVQHGSSSSGQ